MPDAFSTPSSLASFESLAVAVSAFRARSGFRFHACGFDRRLGDRGRLGDFRRVGHYRRFRFFRRHIRGHVFDGCRFGGRGLLGFFRGGLLARCALGLHRSFRCRRFRFDDRGVVVCFDLCHGFLLYGSR
jgi:hypothetical protein